MGSASSRYGFTAAQINDATTVTAYLAGWHEPPASSPPHLSYMAATYGACLAGHGRERGLWGGGTTNFIVPMLAHGVERLLAEVPPGSRLVVHAHPELHRYVGTTGLIAEGRRPQGYEVLARVAAALRDGRWEFRPLGGKQEPGPKAAMRLARGAAREALSRHRDQTTPSFAQPTAEAFSYVEPRQHSILIEGEER